MAQEGPKMAQEGPKRPPAAPQEEPREAQRVPKVPREPQEGSIRIRVQKLSKTIVPSHILTKNRPKPLYGHTFGWFKGGP